MNEQGIVQFICADIRAHASFRYAIPNNFSVVWTRNQRNPRDIASLSSGSVSLTKTISRLLLTPTILKSVSS